MDIFLSDAIKVAIPLNPSATVTPYKVADKTYPSTEVNSDLEIFTIPFEIESSMQLMYVLNPKDSMRINMNIKLSLSDSNLEHNRCPMK